MVNNPLSMLVLIEDLRNLQPQDGHNDSITMNMETAQNLLQGQLALKIISYRPRKMKVAQAGCDQRKLIRIASIQAAGFLRD